MEPECWTKINETYIYEVIPADRHGNLTDKKRYLFHPHKKAKYIEGKYTLYDTQKRLSYCHSVTKNGMFWKNLHLGLAEEFLTKNSV